MPTVIRLPFFSGVTQVEETLRKVPLILVVHLCRLTSAPVTAYPWPAAWKRALAYMAAVVLYMPLWVAELSAETLGI